MCFVGVGRGRERGEKEKRKAGGGGKIFRKIHEEIEWKVNERGEKKKKECETLIWRNAIERRGGGGFEGGQGNGVWRGGEG